MTVILPDFWEEAVDPDSGETYYYNTETNETSWDPPGSEPQEEEYEEEEVGEGEWAEATDPSTGEIYYYHTVTHETKWELSDDDENDEIEEEVLPQETGASSPESGAGGEVDDTDSRGRRRSRRRPEGSAGSWSSCWGLLSMLQGTGMLPPGYRQHKQLRTCATPIYF